MSCVYPPSDVFRLAEPVKSETFDVKERVEFVYGSECHTVYESLGMMLNRDVIRAHADQAYGHEMPEFFLLCHPEEKDREPGLTVNQYGEPFVEVRNILFGVPLSYNFQIYVTDPALLGIIEGVPLPASLTYAKKIVAMRKP